MIFIKDASAACDNLLQVIDDMFYFKYNKKETSETQINWNNAYITLIIINLDYPTIIKENKSYDLSTFFPIYDIEHVSGFPMLVFITLQDQIWEITPCYKTLYGSMQLDTNAEKIAYLEQLLNDMIDLHQQNQERYLRHKYGFNIDNNTPGFEVITLIASLSFLYIFMKKLKLKTKNH